AGAQSHESWQFSRAAAAEGSACQAAGRAGRYRLSDGNGRRFSHHTLRPGIRAPDGARTQADEETPQGAARAGAVSQWRWLTKDVILAIHDEQLAEHGGRPGIRDLGLLESALARPMNSAAYGEPTVFDLAAAYAFGIIRDHP